MAGTTRATGAFVALVTAAALVACGQDGEITEADDTADSQEQGAEENGAEGEGTQDDGTQDNGLEGEGTQDDGTEDEDDATEGTEEDGNSTDGATDGSDPDGDPGERHTGHTMLTEAEFPLAGFTAGEVSTDHSDSTIGEDIFTDFPGVDALSAECQQAMQAVTEANPAIESQSSITFTGPASDQITVDPEVGVAVASFTGEDPIPLLDAVASSCGETEFDEDGVTGTIGFQEVQGDAHGVVINLNALGLDIDITAMGRTTGSVAVMVTAFGVTEDEVLQVLEAQEAALADG